jgi:hypothetical protein
MPEAFKILPKHQDFLDNHFGVQSDWMSFHKKLKDPSFLAAVQADTRTNDSLRTSAEAIGMREQTKGRSVKVPSDVSGNYKVKYHPQQDRFSCSCPDWTYKQSVSGGDCKHVQRLKQNAKDKLMNKEAALSPLELIFRLGRTAQRSETDQQTAANLKVQNQAVKQQFPQPGFVESWLKQASLRQIQKEKLAESIQLAKARSEAFYPPEVRKAYAEKMAEDMRMARALARAARGLLDR